MQPISGTRIKRIICNTYTVCENVAIPKHIFRDSKIDVIEDYAAHQLVIQLIAFLSSNETKLTSTKIEHIPETWFDAFKYKFFPEFLLKIIPIKWRTITITSTTYITKICPQLETDPQQDHLTYLITEPL